MPILEHTEHFVEVLQKAIGIAGSLIAAVGVLFPSVRRWLETRSEKARGTMAPIAAAAAGSSTSTYASQVDPGVIVRIRGRLADRHSLLELAFAFLFAGAFSIVFADALFDENVSLANPLRAFLGVVGMTTLVVVLLCVAWFQRQLEFAVGTMSVTGMLVLLLSSHSSLLMERADYDAGNLLLLPILGLLAASSGAIGFLFGNPFLRGADRWHVVCWSAGIAIVLGLAAGVVGRQKVRALEADPRTPTVYSKHVNDLAASVSAAPDSQRKVFYQLASELHLASEYRSSHGLVEAQLRSDHELLRRLAGDGARSEGAAPASTSSAGVPASTAPASTSSLAVPSNGAPVPTSTSAAQDALSAPSSNDATPEMDQLGRAVRPEKNPSRPLYGSEVDDQTVSLRRSELRRNLMSTLLGQFRKLPPQSRSEYMLARLEWVHPLGSQSGESRAVAVLLGTTALKRYRESARLRVNHAFAPEDQSPERMTAIPSYESPVPEAPAGAPEVRGFFEYDNLSPSRQDILFKPLPKKGPQVELGTQLTWPRAEEAWAAYEEYKELVYSDFGKEVRDLFRQHDALSSTERDAFRDLVVTSDRAEERLVAFHGLAAAGLDYRPIAEAETALDVQLIAQKLRNPDATLTFADKRLAELVQALLSSRHLNIDQRQSIAEFLDQHSGAAQLLFSSRSLDLIRGIMAHVDKSLRPRFLRVLAEPVEQGVLAIAANYKVPAGVNSKHLQAQLGQFVAQKAAERESVLLRLAKQLYGAGGVYAFLPHQQLVYTAREVGRGFGILVAGLLTLPFLLLAVLAGTFIARKLRAHHRRRSLLEREVVEHASASVAESAHILGTSVPIRGRGKFLQSLEGLSGRGWTTTAVVGRRGVGKSRALYELMAGHGSKNDQRVTVWVSAPTEFDEKEFVLTMLEQLADSVETTVAKFLGAEPFAVRQAEAKIASAAMVIFGLGVSAVTWLAFIVKPAADPVTVAVSLLPAASAVFLGGLFMVAHVMRLQPVNLEPWLEKDRVQQVATALLYREARRIRATTSSFRAASRWPAIGMTLVIAISVATVSTVVLQSVRIVRDEGALLLCFVAISVAVIVWRSLVAAGHVLVASDRGFMGLIANYRSFAKTVVRRMNEGALGERVSPGRVVVAIDELDKMPIEDIKTFVRRIKAVFEVPGIYYYVSISEDALVRLYLGGSTGKDEFDSSFDHILQLQPLDAEQAAQAARDFLEKVGVGYSDQRLPAMVGVVSLGVPRDVLRRVDELRDWEVKSSGELALRTRRRSAELGYRAGLLSREQKDLAAGDAQKLDAAIVGILAQPEVPPGGIAQQPEALRLCLSCWVLAALEIIVQDPSEDVWLLCAERLREFGYRVSIDRIADLTSDLAVLRRELCTPISSVGSLRSVPSMPSPAASGRPGLDAVELDGSSG